MIKASKIRQLLALLVICASLAIAIAISLKVYWGRQKAELLRKLPQNIDVSLQKIHLTETRNGTKKWDLVADQAEFDKRRDVTHLTGVRLVVAGDRATGDITMTAPQADYHNTSRDVTLAGKVEAKSVSGMEFTAEGATYDAARSLITTPSRIRFTDRRMTLEGTGMEFKPETRNVRILSKVTANIVPGAAR